MKVQLLLDGQVAAEIDLNEGERIIGSAPPSKILIEDPSVSPTHAKVYQHNGQVFIVDIGSQGGTFVNGQVIEAPMALANGSSLKIGIFDFHIQTTTQDSITGNDIIPNSTPTPPPIPQRTSNVVPSLSPSSIGHPLMNGFVAAVAIVVLLSVVIGVSRSCIHHQQAYVSNSFEPRFVVDYDNPDSVRQSIAAIVNSLENDKEKLKWLLAAFQSSKYKGNDYWMKMDGMTADEMIEFTGVKKSGRSADSYVDEYFGAQMPQPGSGNFVMLGTGEPVENTIGHGQGINGYRPYNPGVMESPLGGTGNRNYRNQQAAALRAEISALEWEIRSLESQASAAQRVDSIMSARMPGSAYSQIGPKKNLLRIKREQLRQQESH